jgi:hypothetical protein
VLGPAFADLAPELRRYFGEVDVSMAGVGSGVFDVAGSSLRVARPMLAFLGWRRVLFAEVGHDIPFDIVNSPATDGSLTAVRTLHFPKRDRPLEDTMRVIDGRLHDFLGRRRGLEARFTLTVTDGLLNMRSDRLWLRLAGLRIRLPRVATVTIAESWVEGKQHVDVRLVSPLVGEWFRYAGSFEYRYEPRR